MLSRATLVAWPAIVLGISLANYAKSAAVADQGAEQKAAEGQPAAEPPADAAQKSAEDLGEGRLIRLRLPLTDNADSQFKSTVERVVEELKRAQPKDKGRPTLVIELWPTEGEANNGEETKFSRALEIANYLISRDLTGIKTVAYVPRTIKGHGVLIVLACEKIVMNPDAELGEATIDADDSLPVDATTVSAYQRMVSAKRTVPDAVALGMIDRNAEVVKVETDQGTEFKLASQLDDLKKDHTIISQETIFPKGSLGRFTGSQGRDYGVLQATDVKSLARVLGVTAESIGSDQSRFGNLKPVVMHIEGPITTRSVHQLETMIGNELARHQVNWICFKIDSTGGELEDCSRLAKTIAGLRARGAEAREVHSVAYVPVDASGGAAVVAMACDELILQSPPEAHIGTNGKLGFNRQKLEDFEEEIRESIAQDESSRTWSAIAAMIDPDIELFAYNNIKTGSVRYFCDEEAKAQKDAGDWRRGARVKAAGEPLWLPANRAKELGFASRVVNTFDDLKQLYGINSNIRVAEPNWALELIEALSSPGLAVLLLVIGFVGVYVELHAPGTGVGAFVAAVAFLLFFWSQFLAGNAEWLEVLLFLGGVFCVLLEVLVLPGFGIFGLGGGAMILVSIVLATQTFVLPRTESQMIELRHSLTIVTAATLIVIASSIALRRYLPSAPIFNKLLLDPTPEEDLVDLDYRESLADFSHLVGEQGVATTNLMPSGKAEFNGQLVDVISEGLPIDRGSAIVVVKARGNRVLVRAVDA